MTDQTTYLAQNELKTIPFVDALLPYTECFLGALEETIDSIGLLDKLHAALLQEMSFAAEVILQEELDRYKSTGQNGYQEFIETTALSLATKYPVLDKILKTIANNYLIYIQKIFSSFSKDFDFIVNTFSIKANNIIKDIDASLGDGHSGESTALITLSDGTKLIYKPRNIEATQSYNLFIDWANHKLDTNLKTIKCVGRESYGWLEFVHYESVNSPDELQEYYYEAGILLAVTLLLGSKDCHYENIIASGKHPVIIDHETIVQPVLSDQSIRTWDEQHKVPYVSVLESMLIVNRDTGIPLEYAGYGIRGNVEVMDIEKKVIDPNTIDSKRDTRFVFRKLIKQNIPFYKDIHVFANNYGHFFIEGFSAAYDMFLASREELTSGKSPVLFFENQIIRYVWRPTFIYFRILKYLRKASFMSSFDAYRSKLYELMSKAYQKADAKNYRYILEFEMEQLLNGDIPLFDLNSSDCHLGADKSFEIFKYNCIESIRQRISSFSAHHKSEQIEYITNWLQINTSARVNF